MRSRYLSYLAFSAESASSASVLFSILGQHLEQRLLNLDAIYMVAYSIASMIINVRYSATIS
jgi:hypothetical protein